MREVPTSKTPKKFRATATRSSMRETMNRGDCNWKPQPRSSPPARRTRRMPERIQKEMRTPAVKARP